MVTNVLYSDDDDIKIEKEEEEKQIDIYSELECDRCHKKITENEGFFLKEKDSYKVFYFDTRDCKTIFKRRLEAKSRKELIIKQRLKKCENSECSQMFDPKSKSSDRKYCSRKCKSDSRPKWYDLYNWCDMCHDWILKIDSILIPKGTKNPYGYYQSRKDIYKCPRCNNRLKTSVGSRYNIKKKYMDELNNNNKKNRYVFTTV